MNWNDERLGDLSGKVDDLRKETREEFKTVRSEMKDLRSEARAEIQALHRTVENRFDGAQRSMLWMMGTIILLVVASILASARL